MAESVETSPRVTVLFGPRASWAMPMWQAGMLGRYFNIHNGNRSATNAGPQRLKSKRPSTMQRRYTPINSSSSQGIMSAPSITPSRSGSGGVSRRPASTHAMSATAKPSWISRFITLRLFRGRTYCFGSKSATMPPKGAGQARVVERQPPDAAAARQQRRPKGFLPDADRADDPQPRNDDVSIGRHAFRKP